MTRPPRYIALAVVGLLAGPGAVVRADDRKAEARHHFQRGDALLQRGDASEALEEFLAAYRLFPTPRMHFAIAQAYRMKGDRATAVDHYRLYLAAVPGGKEAAEARRQLALLSGPRGPTPAEKAEQARLERERAAQEQAERERAEREHADRERAARDADQARRAREAAVAVAVAPPKRRRAWVWGLVGAAAAAVAVGLAVGLTLGLEKDPAPTIGTWRW